jgi:UDP-N-acetylglucosamine 1-carboxyvinyltransferase
MEKFVIEGGTPLVGEITNQGAKNVALKMSVAALLTDDPVILHNVPKIRDIFMMLEVLKALGVDAKWQDHSIELTHTKKGMTQVPLDVGARLRTSSLVLGPLLARFGSAMIPNPGGCRLGARPIDRHVKGLIAMGATIDYDSADGYFHATSKGLHGTTVTFEKNTHTGTETIILAAVLASGKTIIENAAQEIEIDDLIGFLHAMGANVRRTKPNEIVIEGVAKLHGTEYRIMPDRNEEVTWAIAAAVTRGNIIVHDSVPKHLSVFYDAFIKAGGIVESIDEKTTRYTVGQQIKAVDVTTLPHPGFMTDWQAPWAVFMTQAKGISTVHETVFESRFSYVKQLQKMGAKIEFFEPEVENPEALYNFNWQDKVEGSMQAIKITGPRKLHNGVVDIDDIRAGASVIIAAMAAEGESFVYRAETVDRGYEAIEERLRNLGGKIIREREDIV